MNLVQEKYIRESINDINENGYHKKILGFIAVDVFLFLIYLFGSRYIDNQESYLPIKTAGLFFVPLLIGVIITALYVIRTLEIPYHRYLSFYYFYNYMGLAVLALYFQFSIFGIIGYIRLFGLYVGLALQLLIWTFAIAERTLWFYRKTYRALYEKEDFKNPLFDRLQDFVSFAKKYGWIIILALTVIRLIAGRGNETGSGDLTEIFVLFFYPLLFVAGYYFVFSMCAYSFQGYYLKKYSEPYRYLMDYSREEWYGMQ